MAHTQIDCSPALRSLASEPVITELNQCLTTTYALSALAQNAHWNVTGPTFSELHELFGDIYDYTSEAVDDLAERIRQLDRFVTVDLAAFQMRAGITQPVPPKTSTEWLSAVLAGVDKAIGDMGKLKSAAGNAQDLDVQDLGVQISQKLKKFRWKIFSTLN